MIVQLTLRNGECVTLDGCTFERDGSGRRFASGKTRRGRVRVAVEDCRRQLLLHDKWGWTHAGIRLDPRGRRGKAAERRG